MIMKDERTDLRNTGFSASTIKWHFTTDIQHIYLMNCTSIQRFRSNHFMMRLVSDEC